MGLSLHWLSAYMTLYMHEMSRTWSTAEHRERTRKGDRKRKKYLQPQWQIYTHTKNTYPNQKFCTTASLA